jgi:hypothetical protein
MQRFNTVWWKFKNISVEISTKGFLCPVEIGKKFFSDFHRGDLQVGGNAEWFLVGFPPGNFCG